MPNLIRSDTPQPYELMATRRVTHDVKAFRFKLPDRARLDFLPGDCITIAAPIEGETLERPYTPCLPPWTEGYFELTIKRYDKGRVSKYIHDTVKVGDKVMIAGPFKGHHYTQGMAKRIGMVAGGTGITPMLSIVRTIMERGDPVGVWLLFANKEEHDIICRKEFDLYAERDNFWRAYTLDTPPVNWTGFTGRVTQEMMQKALPVPNNDTIIFVCGPDSMVEALKKTLVDMGHAKERIIVP